MFKFQIFIERLKLLFDIIIKNLNVFSFFSFIFFVTGIVILLRLISARLKSKRIKQIYRVNKKKKNYIQELTKEVVKNRIIKSIIENIAFKISMFNNYSYERNMEFSVGAVSVVTIVIISSIFVFMPPVSVIWYILLFYIFMAFIFMFLVFYVFTMIARSRFNNQLPQTYKILNSRYITSGSILKAINISLNDFDRAVKREMIKVYDSLNRNHMSEIDNTFRMIEKTYKNEYVTLLLNLIKQAHYKGGDKVIKEQIENTTEEILVDIANQKDLSAATRTYIFLSIMLLPSLVFVEKFNQKALGDASVEFYKTPYGIGVKIAFMICLMFYIGMMLFMERTSD